MGLVIGESEPKPSFRVDDVCRNLTLTAIDSTMFGQQRGCRICWSGKERALQALQSALAAGYRDFATADSMVRSI
jgi:hypothetical protein